MLKTALMSTLSFAEKTELTIEDKYKKTMQEIEVLKDELGNEVFPKIPQFSPRPATTPNYLKTNRCSDCVDIF